LDDDSASTAASSGRRIFNGEIAENLIFQARNAISSTPETT
jgi:hypothetical protein